MPKHTANRRLRLSAKRDLVIEAAKRLHDIHGNDTHVGPALGELLRTVGDLRKVEKECG